MMTAGPSFSHAAAELQVMIPFSLCISLHHGGIIVVAFVPFQLQGYIFLFCVTKHNNNIIIIYLIFILFFRVVCDLINIRAPFLFAFIEV